MCRLVAYLGPPVTLESLLLAPEHALVEQSYAPRHQRHGRINADGFGVGWYSPLRPEPARYRTTRPMWSDASFANVAGVVESGAIVAAVRNATPGLPVDESCTPPYTEGRWLCAHNGRVLEFPGAMSMQLHRELSDRRVSALQGATDSEVLFALVLDAIDAGADPLGALAQVVARVADAAPGSRLNLVLCDGDAIYASRCGDTLCTRRGNNNGGDVGVVVASEPFDGDEGWEPVPDGRVLVATPDSLRTEPIR